MINRRDFMAAGAAAAASVSTSTHAQAAFPAHPIKIVVPFAPGGTADIQARIVGDFLGKALGQPIVIEDKPGGGTVIASSYVAHAPADGYTLLLIGNSFVINAKLHAKTLPYDGIKAFEPVASLTNSPQVIAVNAASPYKTFQEWLAAAKSKPEAVSLATVGPATAQHIASEMLQRAAGIRVIYTAFTGGAPAVNAVLAGHVDTVLANLSEMQPFLESGKMRALAVTMPQRVETIKQVPTVAESGYPGFEAAAWFGLCAPAGTPKDAIAKIAKTVGDALADAETRKKLIAVGLEPWSVGPTQFAAHIADQFTKYSKVIDEAGIKA